jgi:hypothetical protein
MSIAKYIFLKKYLIFFSKKGTMTYKGKGGACFELSSAKIHNKTFRSRKFLTGCRKGWDFSTRPQQNSKKP